MVKAKKSRSSKSDSITAKIVVRLFNGEREEFDGEVLLRLRDGQQKERYSDYLRGPQISMTVPFSNNFIDDYVVLVTADGYRDAGFFPVHVSPDLDAVVDLMLVPKHANYTFLKWADFKSRYPRFAGFLCCAGDAETAEEHYSQLISSRPASLASLLNLTAAMSTVQLPVGTPLDYFKSIEWGETLAQDRFFGFADACLVQQVKTAAAQGLFVAEPAPGLFHGDATSSYKQVQFGEANLQLTFHEQAVETIGGVKCIRVEPDIDYYKDIAAHALLEVIPNTLSHGLTDPQVVYVLRWIASRHAGVASFDPGYVLE